MLTISGKAQFFVTPLLESLDSYYSVFKQIMRYEKKIENNSLI